eukprot:4479359-Amphidinium_carterae.1
MDFGISSNGFTGVLSRSGLFAMRTMSRLRVDKNRFAGTLPNWVVSGLSFSELLAQENDLEGKHRLKIPRTRCTSKQ